MVSSLLNLVCSPLTIGLLLLESRGQAAREGRLCLLAALYSVQEVAARPLPDRRREITSGVAFILTVGEPNVMLRARSMSSRGHASVSAGVSRKKNGGGARETAGFSGISLAAVVLRRLLHYTRL